MLLGQLHSVLHSLLSDTQSPLNSLIAMPRVGFFYLELIPHCKFQSPEALLLITCFLLEIVRILISKPPLE